MIVGIIHAGGESKRYKTSSPKQFRELDNKPIVDYSVETMRECGISHIILTVTDGWEKYAYDKYHVEEVITAAETRQYSSYEALKRCPENTEIVVIHDAARPLIKASVMQECINAVLDGADGAEPVLKPVDTITEVRGRNIIDIPKRGHLRIAHTPQVFDYCKILAAYRKHRCHLEDFTDDMGVAVASGLECVAVRGTIEGYKLTFQYDYDFLTNLKFHVEAKPKSYDVKKKHVLLFGASGGIGSEVKKILEARGATVHAPSSKEVDLSEEDIDLSWLGDKYDSIINCAGVMYKDDIEKPDNFDRLVNIHFRSCVNIVRYAPKLLPRGGNIVFIGSSAALSPRGTIAIYSAMKSATVNFTRSAAELLKPHNIRVNCVSPARTKTNMMKVIGLYDSECLNPTDVAMYIVDFAFSPHTGQTVNVRKGMTYS